MIQYTEIYFVLMYVYMNHETDGIDLERVVGFTLTNIFHFLNLSSLNKKAIKSGTQNNQMRLKIFSCIKNL